MFSDLEKTYFGKRVIKSVTDPDQHGMVVVTFADDQKPETEKMHASEWENGKSDKPMDKPDKVQEWFVKRTSGMRQELIKNAISFNPRFTDLKKIIAWIEEGINMTYSRVVSVVFGVENFDTQATVDMILKRLEEDGQELTDDKWTEAEKIMLKLIRDQKVLVHQITTESFFGSIQNKMENLISEGVALALGGSDEARRCNNLEELIQQYAKARSTTGSEGMGEDHKESPITSTQSENQTGAQSEGHEDAKEGAA